MAVFYTAGISGTGISTTLTTLTHNSINLGGGAKDRSPDDSSNPITLGTNELTVGEAGDFLFTGQVNITWSSTNPSAGDYAELHLEEDPATGTFAGIITVRVYHEKGDQAATFSFAHVVSAANYKYRLRGDTTGPTVNFGSGRFTIYRDGLVDADVAPADAQYIVGASDGDLDNELVATSGEGVAVDLDTSGGTATFDLDINGLTADASPDGATDYVATWDASAGVHKKVLLDDIGGGGGGAPTNAQYVTLATDATLSDERVLTGGEGVTFADGGAGGAATLTLNAPGLASFTAPLSTDYLIIYDDTAKAHKRVTLANLLRVQQAGLIATTGVAGAGGSASLGIALAYHLSTMDEGDFAGTPVADAITALEDFQSNGDWRNLRSVDADAVSRTLQRLAIFQNWDGAGT